MSTDLTVALAHRFAGNLLDDIGMDNLRIVIARNATEPNATVCHSHDFCDANMTMAAAFAEITGRDPLTESGDDAALWNAAWEHALRLFPLYVRAE